MDAPIVSIGSEANTESKRGNILGRYIMLDQLGEGGMGVVYAAYDPKLDRRVALKLLRPSDLGEGAYDPVRSASLRSCLLREAQALAKLTHPNVVAVFDVGEFDETVFIAMEHVRGTTWRSWSEQQTRSWRDVVGVGIQAGRGLAAAHQAGIVHRDFKPDNVLVDTQDRAYVLDFGLARAIDSSSEATAQHVGIESSGDASASANSATITGTPPYMPPEQFSGLTDARSDQFSFCAALFEMLTGRRAFCGSHASNHESAIHRIRASYPENRRVPRHLRDAISRGLENDPARRFASMQDLLDALTHDPWRQTRRAVIGVVAATALCVGAWNVARVTNTELEQ